MHGYYTPKPIEFQAVLAIFTIFVNYADFYVNIIMSTDATANPDFFAVFNYFPISWEGYENFHTTYWFCKFSCSFYVAGKYCLPATKNCAI